ncbi:MAG: GH92 family glycosyl hydrolase [Phocaeicola sp.]|nr:GH92 family glycosyl hydrolase [Phocaeicola sp.]
MNKNVLFAILLVGTLSACKLSNQAPQPVDYTCYVNTFIGAADNGHTFPGACVPFGMIQASPSTGAVGWRYCSEYINGDSIIWGFTQTHLSGTGCMDLGDILVMPVTGSLHRNWDGYRSRFEKSTESASPGYYTVELSDPGVKVELTATVHASFQRYTFHSADSAAILIDLQHGPVWNEKQYHTQVLACETQWEDAETLVGHVRNQVWVDQDYFFVMKFSRPVTNHFVLPKNEGEMGERIIASFDMKPEEELLVKVALSTTGIDGARKNLLTEVPAWDFEGTKMAAHDTWNSYLSRIDVTGTDEEKTNYYTSLYHALIQPNEISDVDGAYRNSANEIVQAYGGKSYSTFSCWDTYRAAHPFYTIMVPERVDGFVNSLVEHGEVQGYIPIWELWGKDNHCMIANHGISIVAEAFAKGFKGFDAEKAFEVIKHGQTVSHPTTSDWETYMKYGYFPADIVKAESVSRSLENVYDDYATADMAKRLGKMDDAAYFTRRAGFYKNMFDAETQFMRPRLSDGSWKSPFNPSATGHASSIGGDYTEGNAWQYTWHVQHDVPGLISLFGGKEAFVQKLDSMFVLKLETTVSDVTGLIGQYAHGNEPSHHIAYLYTLAGYPDKAADLIRQIFDTQYNPRPDGLCGNDDCGQMSAWYMFSAMGFYPVDPVSCKYIFGAPQLPKIVLHLQDGKTFTVIADGLSKEHKYVESITLNGEPYTKNFIIHEDVMKGGTLVFKMR